MLYINDLNSYLSFQLFSVLSLFLLFLGTFLFLVCFLDSAFIRIFAIGKQQMKGHSYATSKEA